MRTTSALLRRTAALLLPVAFGGVLIGTADAEATLPDELSDYPRPAVTGEQLADAVEAFSTGNPLRITGLPTQTTAFDRLAAEGRALGLQVETKTYDGILSTLVLRKAGTDRADEVIVFSAHVDTIPGTVTGAYDNASGVRAVMALAQAFSQVPTHRTLEFQFYNGEEEGLLASTETAAEYKAARKQVSAVLNFDMVGIAWPVGKPIAGQSCLCIWRGARDVELDELLAEVNHEFLRFPSGKDEVSLEGRNNRSSDEAAWANAGFRTLRWAGLRTAAAYPQYHLPGDDMATIAQTAGGRQFFAQGMANTVLSAYYTAAALDLDGVEPPAPVAHAPQDRQEVYTGAHFPGDPHPH